MEHGATVLDPYQKFNSDKIEMVQRIPARVFISKYTRYSSVSDIPEELGWSPLSQRKQDDRQFLLQIDGNASNPPIPKIVNFQETH